MRLLEMGLHPLLYWMDSLRILTSNIPLTVVEGNLETTDGDLWVRR